MSSWLWRYEGFDPAGEGHREALLTLGNGYFATRGALAESRADGVHYPGTYVAGVYDRLSAQVAGREVENESLVNVPNWLVLRMRAQGGDWFDTGGCEVLDHHVELDMRRAVLTRRSRLEDREGRIVDITQRRFVSLRDPHLAAMQTTVVAENWSGPLEVVSAIDGTVTNSGVERYAALGCEHLSHVTSSRLSVDTVCLGVETNDSKVQIAMTARTRILVGDTHLEPERETTATDRYTGQRFVIDVVEGEEVIIEKVVTLFTSRDSGVYEPHFESHDLIASTADNFDVLAERHVMAWEHAWRRCQIHIDDRDDSMTVLNLHLFHVLQTISRNSVELDISVPARGMHGEAYRGHIFWDEVFIFPLLNWRMPELARAILMYRARRLDRARRNAVSAGASGALYPWQSAGSGREETQTLHLNPQSGRWLPDASRLQRHVDAAIVHMVWHYWSLNRDMEFMRFWGAEMVLEIARFWATSAEYNHSLDRYEIKGVMGPDEYHEGYVGADGPGLDNNSYTNLMAVWCIRRALDVLDVLPRQRGEELRDKLAISGEEIDRWRDVTTRMRLCFNADGVLSQFEGWDDLEDLDWDAYRRRYTNIGRMDRILEAEGDTPNRYKLAKQADVVMLLYLMEPTELVGMITDLGYEVGDDFVERTVDYYEARTSHGSTLSMMVYSWLHARMGRSGAWEGFRAALRSDVDDLQGGTTAEGVHLGVMAGTADFVQRCLTGMELRGDVLCFDPAVPPEVATVRFEIRFRGHPVEIEATGGHMTVIVERDSEDGDEPVLVEIAGQRRALRPGDEFRVELA